MYVYEMDLDNIMTKFEKDVMKEVFKSKDCKINPVIKEIIDRQLSIKPIK